MNFDRPVGLQMYGLRYELKNDVPETIKKVADWGIQQLELSSYYGYTPKDFKALLKPYKMKIPSMIFGFNRFEKNMDGIVAEAKLFGAKYVGVGWLPQGKEFTKEDAKSDIDEMNRFASACKKQGLTFF